MIKKLRKGVSLALALLTMASAAIPVNAAALIPTGVSGFGSGIVALTDDSTTELSWDADAAGHFKTAAADGRIWVDKSVEDKGTGTFDVKLKALTQEYISEKAGADSSVAADVVFVLDGSGSISDTNSADVAVGSDSTGAQKIKRIKAMIDAANEAVGIIMKANPKNRVAVYMYGGAVSGLTPSSVSEDGILSRLAELLPLDSYTLGEASDQTSREGEYLIWGGDYAPTLGNWFGFNIYINSTLKNSEGDLVAPQKGTSPNWLKSLHYVTADATPIQQGVAYAVNKVSAKIQADKNDVAVKGDERLPFMFLLSDGGATYGYTNWWQDPSGTGTRIGTGGEIVVNAPDQEKLRLDEITATTILSNAKKKSELTAAYNDYNTAGGFPVHDTRFYTLGLGGDIKKDYTMGDSLTDKNSLKYAWMGIEPLAIERALGDTANTSYSQANQEAAGKLKQQIAAYVQAAGQGYEDYINEDVYNYSDVYGLANTTEALGGVFDQLANEVASLTKEIMSPVTPNPDDASTITFMDKIGTGMEVKGAPSISINGGAAITGQVAESSDAAAAYSFKGLDGRAIVHKTNGIGTSVEWKLSANDLKLCTILISETNPGEVAYDAKAPLELTYPVGLINDTVPSGADYYTNAFIKENGKVTAEASAHFMPSVNNPYYYFTNKTSGSIGTLSEVGYKTGEEISHYVKGTKITASSEDDFAALQDIYVTAEMNGADSAAFPVKSIGTVIATLPVGLSLTEPVKTAISKSIEQCVAATDADDTAATFAFKVGTPKEHSHFLNKDVVSGNNSSGTAEYIWTEAFVDGTLTILLGNNARINFLASLEKTVDKSEAVKGDILTYSIKVTNHTAQELTGLKVTDDLPAALTLVSAGTGVANGNRITWSAVSVPANGSATLTVTATVPDTAQSGDAYSNTAKITEYNNTPLTVPAESNEAETMVSDTPSKTVTITVNKDDTPWADHNKTFVLVHKITGTAYDLDDSSLPEGEYTIYEGTKDAHPISTNTTVTIGASGGTATVDYYTLSLITTDGVTQTTGAGIYPKDTTVAIDATLDGDSNFVNWTGNAQTINSADNKGNTVKVTKPTTLTANAAKKLYSITPNITKDGASYGEDVGLSWSDGNGVPVADISRVPSGTYSYVVNDGKGGTSSGTVTVNGANATVNIEYFTLAVNKGTGIASISGEGTYLKGTQVPIEATLEGGYTFAGWTGDATVSGAASNPNAVVVDSTKVVTATATRIPTYNVTVLPQLDGGVYPGLDSFDFSKFTVKKADGTGTAVPVGPNGGLELESGAYTLLYNGSPLPANVGFSIGTADMTVSVAHYTLALEHDYGVASVTANQETLTDDKRIYLAGTQVTLAYTLKTLADNAFEGWITTDGNTDPTNNPIIVMDKKQHYVATSKAKETEYFKIPVLVNLDNNAYTNYDYTKISLKKDGVSYHARLDATAGTWYIEVPAGTGYEAYADGIDTKLTIDVAATDAENAGKTITVDYYTLILEKGAGAEGIDALSGAKEYLKGTAANILAVTTGQYSFTNWTGDTANVADVTAGSTTVAMNGPVTLTANAEKRLHTVSVDVRLDGAVYTDFAADYPGDKSKITLKDNNDPTKVYEITDEIPNGSYTVCIGGEPTYKNDVVLDKDSTDPTGIVIDYYSLTLEKSTGISDAFEINGAESTAGTFLKGSVVTIEAAAEDNYLFEKWTAVTGDAPAAPVNAKTTVTLDQKTVLKASAERSFSLNSVINVNGTPETAGVPTVVWKDKDGNIVGDPTKVPAGEYTLNVDDGTGNTYTKEVEITDEDVTEALEYFTLEAKAGTGIHDAAGSGIYLSGTKVVITATPKDGYTFDNKWTVKEGVTPVYDADAKAVTVTVNQKTIVTAEGTEKLYKIDISAILNDTAPYTPTGKVVVKDSKGNVVKDLSKVPAGKYTVWVDNKSYTTISVDKKDAKVILKYYTLKVLGDTGVASTTGSGNYLKGTAAKISAVLKTDYAFAKWTGAGKVPASRKGEFTVNGKATLTANTTDTFYKVTVDVNKDGKDYSGFKGEVTLKDKNGNTITDLDRVPNGSYTVWVNDKETNVRVVVDGGAGRITLDYFTLTLVKGDGIGSTKGEGVYLKGTEVSIEALAKAGYTFAGWSGDVKFDSSKNTFVIEGTLVLTANAKKSNAANSTTTPGKSNTGTSAKPTSTSSKPNTGDSSNSLPWFMALLGSAALALGAFRKKAKKN